jgi:hypothetical protein
LRENPVENGISEGEIGEIRANRTERGDFHRKVIPSEIRAVKRASVGEVFEENPWE